jgi:hypothetical protein
MRNIAGEVRAFLIGQLHGKIGPLSEQGSIVVQMLKNLGA